MLQAYLELKLAWELFQKAPQVLNEPERHRVTEVAGRQSLIEQRILASPESAAVVVPEPTLRTRLSEIRQRYPDDDAYSQDLERIGLSDSELTAAVRRDLHVEAVLERIAAGVPATSRVDAEIYYHLHPDAFDRPEARRLRHILVTFDDANGRARAAALLDGLRHSHAAAERFAQAALRHSQCPTAMDGGQLGTVRRGQLYEQLEPAAFALAADEISAVLESPIGLHILRCDEILPSGLMPFAEVADKIIERLTDKRRQEAQRDWIRQLQR